MCRPFRTLYVECWRSLLVGSFAFSFPRKQKPCFHVLCRISNTDIAKEIYLSEGTVRTRLNRLINDEFIQIVAVSNPIKLGFKIVGNIRIHIEIKKMDKIIKELKKLKPLWFIVQTTGGTGIDTEFVVKSLDELNELIFEKINKIDGIVRTDLAYNIFFHHQDSDTRPVLYLPLVIKFYP